MAKLLLLGAFSVLLVGCASVPNEAAVPVADYDPMDYQSQATATEREPLLVNDGAGAGGALIEPIYGNSGAIMGPFTEDNTVAPWVTKAMNASAGASIGGSAGAYALEQATQDSLAMVPFGSFFANMVGKKAGEKIGREAAIKMSGGWDFIRENSDLSFNSVAEMTAHVVQNNRSHPEFDKVVKAASAVYPEMNNELLKFGIAP